MRHHLLPSLKGLVANAHPLRIECARAIDKAQVYARRSGVGVGFSSAAAELIDFYEACIAELIDWEQAASIAVDPASLTVATADRRRTITEVEATLADASTLVVAAPATGTITIGTNPLDGTTVTIGGKVYTFQTTLTNVDGNVDIGADANATATALAAAINLGAGAGTVYAAATTRPTNFYATVSANVVTIVSWGVDHGVDGNAITLAETAANITLSGSTLSGGVFDARVGFASSVPADATVDKYGSIEWVSGGSSVVTTTFHSRTDTTTVTAS